jgi:hypothetical protein
MVTDWPDSPFTQEERIREDHSWARMKRNNPEFAKQEKQRIDDCNHQSNRAEVQKWQGVKMIVKVCNDCGKTVSLFDSLHRES